MIAMRGMNMNTMKTHTARHNILALVALVLSAKVTAYSHIANSTDINLQPSHTEGIEKDTSAWAIAVDNDILVPSSRDQDYTYGSSITIAGRNTADYTLSLHKPLRWLNQKAGVIHTPNHIISHSVEAGLYGFTPEQINAKSPQHEDRPYASIVYWSSHQTLPTAFHNTVWQSTLTVGALGLNIVGDIQNEVHRATNSEQAQGWGHQISEGGELTARYSLARQTRWTQSPKNTEIKTSTQASIGYLTEASWAINMRYGQINTHWQSHTPELTTYGENVNQAAHFKAVPEKYFLMGAAIKAKAYNAFLQGQFKNNTVEYSHDELNHLILEAWLGYTRTFKQGYRLSYLLRGHTSEVKTGVGNRNVMWGQLTMAKTY